MKKVSLIKALTIFLGVFLLTASLFQCTKVGDNIEHLNRSYPNNPDSSIYASFYDEFKKRKSKNAYCRRKAGRS